LLEEHERVLAKKYKVDIEVRCVFSTNIKLKKQEQLYRMDFIKLLDIIIKQKLITSNKKSHYIVVIKNTYLKVNI
jgi:hypothetical protein